MRLLTLTAALLIGSTASATNFQIFDPTAGNPPATKLELAQAAVIESTLLKNLGLRAKVSFTTGFLNPMEDYNRLSDTIAILSNFGREPNERRYGSGARYVTIDIGPAGYRCQALVVFKGELAESNLTFAGLNACAIYITKAGKAQNEQCAAAKRPGKETSCLTPMDLYVPAALHFEIRR